MDLTYMPGELDVKSAKKGNGSDMKREHDSVDDFEHLDPDLSPVDGHAKEKFDIKSDSKNYNLPTDIIEKSHGDDFGLPSKPVDSLPGNISTNSNLSDFGIDTKQIKTEVDFHFDSEGKPSSLDLEVNPEKSSSEFGERFIDNANSITESFISAEIATNSDKTEHEKPNLEIKADDNAKENEQSLIIDTNIESASKDENDLIPDLAPSNLKSMKEDDALPQYEMKFERKESPQKEDNLSEIEKELELPEPEIPKSLTEVTPPALVEQTHTPEPKTKSNEDISESVPKEDFTSPEEFIESPPFVQEPAKPEPIAAKPEPKPTPPVTNDNVKTTVKEMSISDLDDIIGPEDVFKRIGLDAWFTPERLHPKVEALVYWRDPKKSGVVFGGGMAILLSLCVMSLISVIAYTSLFALTGAICFRIYKNILQAVQKTSEGHPFKEFLELELSLPQDKVREVVDTAVVHINAAVVELRRLFLVEDLIDSIKFGVCLWCLTYVGAIFNGMTLVILAFVALFTVPKIYENNKASIDQYIDMGRSKVAEITSKVKAAVPIGKKEPEKDKEQ